MDDALRRSVMFRRLKPDDRHRLASVSTVREFDKGAALFSEATDRSCCYTVLTGRVKVFKTTARGTDVILEIFGPGDPVGAVAVYESRPYPASARGDRTHHLSRHSAAGVLLAARDASRRWFAASWSASHIGWWN